MATHKFTMEMVPLMTVLSLEKIQLDKKKIYYTWLAFHIPAPLLIWPRYHCLLVLFHFRIQTNEVAVELRRILRSLV